MPAGHSARALNHRPRKDVPRWSDRPGGDLVAAAISLEPRPMQTHRVDRARRLRCRAGSSSPPPSPTAREQNHHVGLAFTRRSRERKRRNVLCLRESGLCLRDQRGRQRRRMPVCRGDQSALQRHSTRPAAHNYGRRRHRYHGGLPFIDPPDHVLRTAQAVRTPQRRHRLGQATQCHCQRGHRKAAISRRRRLSTIAEATGTASVPEPRRRHRPSKQRTMTSRLPNPPGPRADLTNVFGNIAHANIDHRGGRLSWPSRDEAGEHV